MKKIILFFGAAILIAFPCAGAFAASDNLASNFSGFAASVGVNFTDGEAHVYGGTSDFRLGDDSYRANVDLMYNAALSGNWLLGGGITFDFGDAAIGSSGFSDNTTGTFLGTTKLSNQFSVYVKPSYALTDKVSFYGKLALEHANAEYKDDGMLYDWPGGQIDKSEGLFGIGYGVGILGLITSHFFVSGEITRVNFDTFKIGTNTAGATIRETPNITQGILSVGYKL